jgi:tetratricopeptide (TPR) repeat protein
VSTSGQEALQAVISPGEAEAAALRLLAKTPGDVAALERLGQACAAQGKDREAVTAFIDAFSRDPGRPAPALGVALALARLGQRKEAVDFLGLALNLHPGDPDLLTTRGNMLRALGRFDEALASHREALQAAPRSAAVHANLTALYLAWGRAEKALEEADAALLLAPDAPELAFNQGTCLLRLGRGTEAVAALEAAVERAPGHAGAWLNLGEAHLLGGDVARAEDAFRRSTVAAPDDAAAHWNLSLRLLARGEWAEGWREYEWRKRLEDLPLRRLAGPFWDGQPLTDGPLVVTAEQGLGDTLQFWRFLPEARRRDGGPLLFEAPPALARLLAGAAGVDAQVVRGEALPPYSAHTPLMSLPGLLEAPVAPAAPWLHAEPARVERWRARLPAEGLRVAIAWQGNPAYKADWQRSVPLRCFERLARVPGVRLISVQRQHGLAQLATWPKDVPLVSLGAELDAEAPFLDTAAVLSVVDVVVASDSAVAHLAAALGRRVWLLLGHRADWRWGLSGETTPWYDDFHLVRQARPDDWETPMEVVARGLEDATGPRIPG